MQTKKKITYVSMCIFSQTKHNDYSVIMFVNS